MYMDCMDTPVHLLEMTFALDGNCGPQSNKIQDSGSILALMLGKVVSPHRAHQYYPFYFASDLE